MNILKNSKIGKFFGRGPTDSVMSKADRVLGRTSGSDDGMRSFHSSSKAERVLGMGQYDPDINMSKEDRVLGRRSSGDISKANRILGRFGGATKRRGGRKSKSTRKHRKRSVKRTRK